eukprot:374074-Pelagomonas_calceolata.AAC.2
MHLCDCSASNFPPLLHGACRPGQHVSETGRSFGAAGVQGGPGQLRIKKDQMLKARSPLLTNHAEVDTTAHWVTWLHEDVTKSYGAQTLLNRYLFTHTCTEVHHRDMYKLCNPHHLARGPVLLFGPPRLAVLVPLNADIQLIPSKSISELSNTLHPKTQLTTSALHGQSSLLDA